MTMRFARMIMGVVLALSVAMLPVAGSMAAGANAKPAAMAGSLAMSAAMDDCCPENANPCDQSGDHCQSTVCCAHQSFGISGVVSPFSYPPVSSNPLPALADHAAPLHAGSPPFRPPRV
jgi:hypothetical protein